MQRIPRVVCSGLRLATFASQSLGAEVLSPTDAARRVGQRVTVELVVRGSGRNGEYQELHSTKDWKEDGCFFVRFSTAARQAFAEAEIPDVTAYFLEETIRVTGEVKQLKFGVISKPVIYVEDVEQIELVSAARSYLSRDKYQQRVLAGFTILVSPEVLKHRTDASRAIRYVESQLKELNKSLPKDKLALLREVPIWVEWEVDPDGAAGFHSSALWLKRHGRNPQKAGSVEISNVQNYVKWNEEKQVSGMLHEMSHAFHNLCLGDDHAGILAAYRQAMQRKLYDSVPAVEGGLRPAYAMNNEKEYFAEMTEAYFGRNDFYPFNREQLKSHDPVAYKLLQQVWLEPLTPIAADASN